MRTSGSRTAVRPPPPSSAVVTAARAVRAELGRTRQQQNAFRLRTGPDVRRRGTDQQ